MGVRKSLAFSAFAVVAAIALAWFLLLRSPAPEPDPRENLADAPPPGRMEAPLENAPVPAEAARAAAQGQPRAPGSEGTASASVTAQATLAIRVVARETGAPLGDVRIRLFREEQELAAASTGRGTVTGKRLATDREGFADCGVAPGERVIIETGERPWIYGPGRIDVETPAANGRAEIVIDVPTAWTVSFFGRVCSEERTPVSGARIAVDSGSGPYADGRLADTENRLAITQSDANGLFELRLPAWHADTAYIDAKGFSLTLVTIEKGHESPATAREVRLRRSATLVVHVFDEHGGCAGAQVTIELRAGNLMGAGAIHRTPASKTIVRWRAVADAKGEAVFEELPSNEPLRVGLEGPRVFPISQQPIGLAPGERRVIELPQFPGVQLNGQVLLEGRPLADEEIWRLAPRADRARHDRLNDRPEDKVESDAAGRFAFEDVPPGTWWICLAPPRGSDKHGLIASPIEVVVVPGREQPEIRLRAELGKTIRGRVLALEGPVARTDVVAIQREPVQRVVAKTDAQGNFEIGPLTSGLYVLQASDRLGDYTPSEELRVEAGASDVVLRVFAAVPFSGRVVDAATRELCAAEVSFVHAHGADPSIRRISVMQGHFTAGILPGNYTACAQTADGRFGYVAGIELLPDNPASEVEIAVRPGARLTLTTKSDEPVWFEVWYESSCVASGTLTEQRPKDDLVLPAGAVTVRMMEGDVGSHYELFLTVGATSGLQLGG